MAAALASAASLGGTAAPSEGDRLEILSWLALEFPDIPQPSATMSEVEVSVLLAAVSTRRHEWELRVRRLVHVENFLHRWAMLASHRALAAVFGVSLDQLQLPEDAVVPVVGASEVTAPPLNLPGTLLLAASHSPRGAASGSLFASVVPRPLVAGAASSGAAAGASTGLARPGNLHQAASGSPRGSGAPRLSGGSGASDARGSRSRSARDRRSTDGAPPGFDNRDRSTWP